MKPTILLFPDFENVFTETDELARYVFFPLASLTYHDHPDFGNNTLHAVSLWDTGNYEPHYLNEYRGDNNWIKFDHTGNKLAYKAPVIFPSIEFLPEAYNIIHTDFEKNKEFYLAGNSYDEFNFDRYCKEKGKELERSFPGIDEFDALFYYKIVLSYMISRERYKRYGVLHAKPTFDISETELHDESYLRSNFMKMGKTDLSHFFDAPEWWTKKYSLPFELGEPEDISFAARIKAGKFIWTDATVVNLLFNKETQQVIHLLEWS